MADHPNAKLVREAHQRLQSEGPAVMAEYLAPDVIWHEIGRAEPRRGMSELAASMDEADFEIDFEVHDVVGGDDHVVALISAHATRGDKTLDYNTAEVMHLKDGKITERWAFSDDTQAIVDFFA